MNNIPKMPNGLVEPEVLSDPFWYSMDVIGELTAAQQQMIYEK